jgi:hypothetical protein
MFPKRSKGLQRDSRARHEAFLINRDIQIIPSCSACRPSNIAICYICCSCKLFGQDAPLVKPRGPCECLPNEVPHHRDDCQSHDALHDGGDDIFVPHHAPVEESHSCAADGKRASR